MIWTDGSVSFSFGKSGFGVLANCSLCGTEATFLFRPAQYVQVFLLKPAPLCKLSAGLGSINKLEVSFLFSLSPTLALSLRLSLCLCYSVLFFIFPFTSNSPEDLAGTVFSLSSCTFRLQRVPIQWFLQGYDAADELARRAALLAPSAISCSLSPLISRIHSYLFSDWRRTVSSKFFDTQVPSISTEELVLPRHARCVLSRLRCNGHSLLLVLISLGFAESRILPAAPADIRPRTSLISFCTVQLRTRCAAWLLVTLYLFKTSGPGPGELPGFLGPIALRHAPIPRKGSGNTSNKHEKILWQERQTPLAQRFKSVAV